MKSLILIFVILVTVSLNLSAQGNVQITIPISGTQVSQSGNTIGVTVRNGVAAGQCVVVFVQDPNKNWWPYFMDNNSTSGSNSWVANGVEYGVSIDKGKRFNIRAVIMNSSVQINGLGISTNQDGSVRLNIFAAFINGMSSTNYSAIVSVTRS